MYFFWPLLPQNTPTNNIKKALEDLNQALLSDQAIDWKAKDFYGKKWNDLHGDDTNKTNVRQALNTLEKSGMMCLTFLHYDADKDPLPEVLDTMAQLVVHHIFSNFTFLDLYTVPADSNNIACDELNFISYDMDGVKLLRSGPPEKLLGCCNRTSRKCVATNYGNCSTCGTSCCLGSSWCQ